MAAAARFKGVEISSSKRAECIEHPKKLYKKARMH